MTVSITSGTNPDISAILAGGEQLQQRIAEFKEHHDKAQARITEAEQAEARAAAIIGEAEARAAAIIVAAQAEADALIAAAVARRKVFDDDLAKIKAAIKERVAAASVVA